MWDYHLVQYKKTMAGKIPSVCDETDRKRGSVANNVTRPFLLFQQIFFILGCIYGGDPSVNPRVPTRAKTLRGQ